MTLSDDLAVDDEIGSSFLYRSWGARHNTAYRVVEDGREATGRSDTRAVAERQVVVLGRHCDLPSGRVLRQAGAREAGAPAEAAASR